MEYREFLQTTLPPLGLRWRRFRSKGVRRRIAARLEALKMTSFSDYRAHLMANSREQKEFVGLLTVTISRFWRNRQLFESLQHKWLPSILQNLPPKEPLRIWSAGCASGEEPYSLLSLWQEVAGNSGQGLDLLASDADRRCLDRALTARYPASSFREMPAHLRQKYCTNEKGIFSLPRNFSERIKWIQHNIIWDPPFPNNHMILCRNLVYTYFMEPLQRDLTLGFHRCLYPGGLLVVGRKDRLPAGTDNLFCCVGHPIYQRVDDLAQDRASLLP